MIDEDELLESCCARSSRRKTLPTLNVPRVELGEIADDGRYFDVWVVGDDLAELESLGKLKLAPTFDLGGSESMPRARIQTNCPASNRKHCDCRCKRIATGRGDKGWNQFGDYLPSVGLGRLRRTVRYPPVRGDRRGSTPRCCVESQRGRKARPRRMYAMSEARLQTTVATSTSWSSQTISRSLSRSGKSNRCLRLGDVESMPKTVSCTQRPPSNRKPSHCRSVDGPEYAGNRQREPTSSTGKVSIPLLSGERLAHQRWHAAAALTAHGGLRVWCPLREGASDSSSGASSWPNGTILMEDQR